jgi:hypothetical protein
MEEARSTGHLCVGLKLRVLGEFIGHVGCPTAPLHETLGRSLNVAQRLVVCVWMGDIGREVDVDSGPSVVVERDSSTFLAGLRRHMTETARDLRFILIAGWTRIFFGPIGVL